MGRLRDINDAMMDAEAVIAVQVNKVTSHLRKILVAGGIPQEIADKYSAEYIHGGEWILSDEEGELASHDYHLMNNDYIIELVKDLENL